MQSTYRVSTVLKSGINKVADDGEPAYLDSVEDFKSFIESELLFTISQHFKNSNKQKVSSTGEYKITADNDLNTLRIIYESPDKEEGIKKLAYLSNMIAEHYEKRLQQFHQKHEFELMTARRQLELRMDEEKFIVSKLSDIQKRTDRYAREIDRLNNSSESKAQQTMLLEYASIVEKIADLKRRQSQVNSAISFYKKEMTDMENEKPGKQAIVVANPPTASQLPIKPKKIQNVTLAAVVGLLVMLFLSFLFEYITKKKG